MIVLKMLREHPLVHVKDTEVKVYADGLVLPATAWRRRAQIPLVTITLPMLAYHVSGDYVARHRWEDLAQLGLSDGNNHEWDVEREETIRLGLGTQYYFRRDKDINRVGEWAYHLFVQDSEEFNQGYFWEQPPVARLRPWREELDDKLAEVGIVPVMGYGPKLLPTQKTG